MGVSTAAEIRAEYRRLSDEVRAAGLLERRPWRASARIVLTLAALGAGWGGLVALGNSWASLGIAVFLAGASVQVLFVGHDAGHEQLFASRRANWIVGLIVGDLLMGLSFSWWVPKHSAHHAFPNQVGLDPDIGPVAAPPRESVAATRPTPLRVLARVVWLVPLVALEAGMHLSSGRSLARRRGRAVDLEWLLLAVHAALYLTVVFSVLSLSHAVAFIVVQQGLFGLYLRLSFAPNHKGMPVIEQEAKMTFAHRQVITSRNVVGSRLTTFMLGGLNRQIEHHLFPMMPRANLVRAQHLVEEFCARSGLDHREERLFDSYRQAVRSLRHPTGSSDLSELRGDYPVRREPSPSVAPARS